MVFGFVLINTSPEREHQVYNQLCKISDIVELYPLFGEYDLIAKIKVKDYTKIGNTIIKRIKTINGVLDTKILSGSKFT
jgi:DNA-binding Lrp family transcriptional regulator